MKPWILTVIFVFLMSCLLTFCHPFSGSAKEQTATNNPIKRTEPKGSLITGSKKTKPTKKKKTTKKSKTTNSKKKPVASSKKTKPTPKINLPEVKAKTVVTKKKTVAPTSSASITVSLIESKKKSAKVTTNKSLKVTTVALAKWLKTSGKLTQAKYVAKKYKTIIASASKKYSNVDRKLNIAQIAIESGGNPLAVSSAGAKGLKQLMPCTIKHYKVKEEFDPEENIMAGTHYLSDLIETFGNVPDGLYGYMWGESGARKRLKAGHESLNDPYVRKVLYLYSQIDF